MYANKNEMTHTFIKGFSIAWVIEIHKHPGGKEWAHIIHIKTFKVKNTGLSVWVFSRISNSLMLAEEAGSHPQWTLILFAIINC